MGVICQPILGGKVCSHDAPFPSERIAELFNEFISRYNEWSLAKRQESMGIFIVLALGLSVLLIPWFIPARWTGISFAVLILFYGALRHYFALRQRASHLYINVHILHHHLIGKLEVGFCSHCEPCHCVEDFRKYVMINYHISLEEGCLR